MPVFNPVFLIIARRFKCIFHTCHFLLHRFPHILQNIFEFLMISQIHHLIRIRAMVKQQFHAIRQIARIGVLLCAQSPPLVPVSPGSYSPHSLHELKFRLRAVRSLHNSSQTLPLHAFRHRKSQQIQQCRHQIYGIEQGIC